MKGHLTAAGALGAVAAALACVTITTPSLAQDTTIAPQSPPTATVVTTPPPLGEAREAYTGPNRALIGTGLVTFGLAYIPAVIVAGQSTVSADHHLYVPVAGPWLSMANRPACGPESFSCDTETTNKVLLGVDGVFQGIGVLTTIAGFLTPEPAEAVTTTAKPSLHVAPAKVGGTGYGVTAFGQF